MSEPWLSGTHMGVDPLLRPILFSLEQSQSDLHQWTEGLSDEAIWSNPHGLAALGFLLRHITGSVDRLFTYAQDAVLNDAQMAYLKSEMEPGATLAQLLADVDAMFAQVAQSIRGIDPRTLTNERGVGRKKLPTTVIGLLIHLAEHTQRHVGEAIITAKLLK